LTKNQKKLTDNVRKFHDWLLNKKDVKVEIIDIDDGVALLLKI
jgi:predicted O-methyltransferase YrrM